MADELRKSKTLKFSGNMDILLIHAGEPPAEGGRIILSPLGTLFLAEYLNQNRINAKIVNTCLIKGDPFQAICSWIKRHKIKIVSLPLHWHQQSSKVISLVTKLKREFPGIKTIIGGSTATFFHREIVNQFSVVDFIIRGDAEIPLLNLIRRIIEGGKDFYRIPNLTWRKKNLIVVNKHIYVCSSAILKSVSHPRNDLFLNNNGFFAENEQYLKKPGMKSAFFNIARGCTGNCPFCGGGKQAQQILYKRKRMLLTPLNTILKTIKRMQSLGVNHIYFPVYVPETRNLYLDLFKNVKINLLKTHATLELYALPDRQFIEELAAAFDGNLKIILSPDTGSNLLRRKIKSFFYSNKMLIKTLQLLCAKGIDVDLQFSTGFPFETEKDFAKTIALVKYVKTRFPVTCSGELIELEPASPMYLYPGYYKITPKRKKFSDFIKPSLSNSIGYSTKNFSEKQIVLNGMYLKKIYEE